MTVARFHRDRRHARRRGLTLIELMVGTAVLTIVILAFNLVVSESRKLVSGTESNMRANAAAAALEQAFREDTRSMSQVGFLCITEDNDGNPLVMFTTAGPATSVTEVGSGSASGTFNAYGLCDNNGGTPVLWKAAWLLDHSFAYGPGSDISAGDAFGGNWDLTNLQVYDRPMLETQIFKWIIGAAEYVPKMIPVNPQNLTQVGDIWKLLAVHCRDLRISWTDGAINDDEGADYERLRWYDRDHPHDSGWATRSSAEVAFPEYADNPAGETPKYRAVFTNRDQAGWPVALRFRFRLADPSLPQEFSNAAKGVEYEIICPLTR